MTRLLMTADAVGGVWTYALDLAGGLAAHGIEVDLAVMGPPPSAEQRLAAAGIPTLTLIETGLSLDWLASGADEVATAAAGIAALAGERGADLIQLNSPALAALARFPAPVVAVTHSCLGSWWEAAGDGSTPADFLWRHVLHGRGLAAADRVVAPSEAFAEATRRVHRLARGPEVVLNGRAALSGPAAAMHDCALTAGRLWDAGKDRATLDRAAARLGIVVHAAGPLSGPGGERIAFRHLHALGTLSSEALAARLRERPVFVSAARYEPFGLAVLEAAQAGCALVLSDIATFRELWEGVALFVEPGDDAGFAGAIDQVVGDNAWRIALGQAARGRAARYTPEAMAAGMAALYGDVLGSRAAA